MTQTTKSTKLTLIKFTNKSLTQHFKYTVYIWLIDIYVKQCYIQAYSNKIELTTELDL